MAARADTVCGSSCRVCGFVDEGGNRERVDKVSKLNDLDLDPIFCTICCVVYMNQGEQLLANLMKDKWVPGWIRTIGHRSVVEPFTLYIIGQPPEPAKMGAEILGYIKSSIDVSIKYS